MISRRLRTRTAALTKPGLVSLALSALVACSGEDDTAGGEPEAADDTATMAAMPVTPQAPAQPPAVDTIASAIPGVVTEGTTVEVIGEGFNGTEGPVSMSDGSLLFTETNENRILRIDAQDQISVFLENTNGSNGLGFDAAGRLISVQTTPGNTLVGAIYPQESVAVLTDNFEGQPYGRPNDLVVSTAGGVYFTDPGPNPPADGSMPPPPPLSAGVYYVAPGAAALRVAEGIRRPNGLVLSPNEQTLYVNNTQGEYLLAFDVAADGTLTNQRDFGGYAGVTTNDAGVQVSGADGLAVDAEGRLYAATTAGVQVFDPTGSLLGIIPVSRAPQNIAFAGPDKRTLYIVGRGAAYKVALLAQGFLGRAK